MRTLHLTLVNVFIFGTILARPAFGDKCTFDRQFVFSSYELVSSTEEPSEYIIEVVSCGDVTYTLATDGEGTSFDASSQCIRIEMDNETDDSSRGCASGNSGCEHGSIIESSAELTGEYSDGESFIDNISSFKLEETSLSFEVEDGLGQVFMFKFVQQ